MQLPAAHRSLAARVISQAVRDVLNPNGAAEDNASARVFLSGSPMLAYWCEIADLDLNCVMNRARALLASHDHGRWDAATVEDLEDSQRADMLQLGRTPH